MFEFYIRNIFLGLGLAMDSGAVSVANGFERPSMSRNTVFKIALLFGFFQGFIPLLGYGLGYLILPVIEPIFPYLSFGILSYLGISMIVESLKKNKKQVEKKNAFRTLLLQAIATSIDALSIGITLAQNSFLEMVTAIMIFAVITVMVCCLGLILGKRYGYRLGKRALLVGGCILFSIGVEMLLKGIL